ncbi:hypothetical protein ACFX2A_040906 [Malus domestica]
MWLGLGQGTFGFFDFISYSMELGIFLELLVSSRYKNILLGMLDEHTPDAVHKKTDESQSPSAGFSINCMFMNHKLIQVLLRRITLLLSEPRQFDSRNIRIIKTFAAGRRTSVPSGMYIFTCVVRCFSSFWVNI